MAKKGFDDVTDVVLTIFIAAILAGALVPTALILLYNVTLTGVPAEVVVIYNVIGIAIAISIVILFFKMTGKL